MFEYDSDLYLGILRITMDFNAGLASSVTEAVEQSMLWCWQNETTFIFGLIYL